MRYNVFGGKGFVGSTFVEINKGECLVNERNDLVPNIQDYTTNILYLISTVDNYNVKTNPYLDIETNLTTLIRVLENFRHTNRNDIVFNFASSWFVYGDTDLPAKETSYCNPKGFYSITKRTAEQLLVSYCETYKLKYRILRFANIVGAKDTKASKKKNALLYLLNELKNHRDINLYDKGEFYRDFITIEDLCSAVKLVMDKGEVNSIYNIGNGVAVTFGDIIEFARRVYESKSNVVNIDQPEFHKSVQVKSMYMDNTKLLNLGYQQKSTVYTFVEKFKDM